MTEQAELGSSESELQEQLKVRFQETGSKLGRLVLRQSLEDGRQSHWIEPGMIIALESNTDDIRLEQLVDNPDLLAEYIISGVGRVAGLDDDQITGPSKKTNVVLPRQVVMYLLREHTSLSFPEIGRILGRDHSTIVYGVDKIKTALSLKGPMLDKKVSSLVKSAEIEIADLLKIIKEEKAQTQESHLEAVAINADGLYAYPAGKIKPLYAKSLGVRDPDTLLLDYSNRLTADWLMQRYGQVALSILNT